MNELGYRPCVGVMLVNGDGQVFVAERIDNRVGEGKHSSGYWQMPQGGVDKGEDLKDAALRELAEETGVTSAMIDLAEKASAPIRYDLPDNLIGKLWGGKYRGQEQIWFFARFKGSDSDIDLEAHDPPEFCNWRWIDPSQLPDVIVPFKKDVYHAVLEEFRELI